MSEVQVKAIAKGIRISPRKVGVVADLVRRRSVADALIILSHTQRNAAQPITKLINSAVANARHNLKLSVDDIKKLEIQTIMVTEAPSMKRYKFVGAGRRAKPRPMLKRSSHVTVILSVTPTTTSAPKKVEAKAPAKKTTVAKKTVKTVKETKK